MKKNYFKNGMRPAFLKTAIGLPALLLLLLACPVSLSALDYYWVGGSGNWSEHSTHWATSSGGNVFHSQVPTSMDDVFFDANSFPAGGTLMIDQTIIYCMDMDWTGASGIPVFTGPSDRQLWIYGSLTLVSGMDWDIAGDVHFLAFQSGKTITSAGQSFISTLYFEGVGGEWTLQDTFESEGGVFHVDGTINSNNQALQLGAYWNLEVGFPYGTPVLNLGSSELHFKNYSQAYFTPYAALSLDADEANIVYDMGGELTDNGHDFLNITFENSVFNSSFASNCNVLNKLLFEGVGTYFGNGNHVHLAQFDQSGSFEAHSTEIDSLLFSEGGAVRGNNGTLHDVVFKGPGGINQYAGNYICENYGSGHQFGRVIFEEDGALFGSNSYDSLVLSPGHKYYLERGHTQTINPGGHFIASGSGCDNFVTLLACESGDQLANIHKDTPDVTLEYVTVRGISVSGGAAFTALNSVDLGGNAGWTFSLFTARDLYWVGGGGEWSDANHWSPNSGGVGGQCLPTAYDNVFFDENSGFGPNDTVNLDKDTHYCHDMDWTGVTNNPTMWNAGVETLNIYGSVTFVPGMDNQFKGDVYFRASSPGQTITSGGQLFLSTLYFEGVGGEWILQDAFETDGTVFHVNGTINSNNQTLRIGAHWNLDAAFPYGTPVLNLGSSEMHFKRYSQTYFRTYEASSLDADEASIVYETSGELYDNGHDFLNITFKGTGYGFTAARNCNVLNKLLFENGGQYSGDGNHVHLAQFDQPGTFEAISTEVDSVLFNDIGVILGNNSTLHDVIFKGPADIRRFAWANNCDYHSGGHQFGRVIFEDDGKISGSNSFDSLVLSSGRVYILENDRIQTINPGGHFIANGSGCDNFVTLQACESGGTPLAKIHKSAPDVTLDYVTVRGISVGGGAVFTALNSVDLGNNAGWNFSPFTARDLYWVGGDGEWSDANHWSPSSGGIGGQCLPTAYDNVFFDENSGFGPNDTVNLDQDIHYCYDMDWTGVTNNPTMWNAGVETLNIYGSVTFVSGMDNQFKGDVYFRAYTFGHTITSGGQSFAGIVNFEGAGGEWTLQDAFETEMSVSHLKGRINSNNQTLRIGSHWFPVASVGFGAPTLYLGTSEMHFKNHSQVQFNNYAPSLLDADHAELVFDFGGEMTDNGHDFLNITFKNSVFGSSATNCNVLNKLLFEGSGGYFGNGNHVHLAQFDQPGYFEAKSTEVDSLLFNDFGAIRGNNGVLHDVVFKGPAEIKHFAWANDCDYYSGGHQFGRVIFEDNGKISGDNAYDSLVFTQGKTYVLESGRTQTISPFGSFVANGTGAFPIEIKACQLGTQATIHKDGAPVCLDYLYLTDMAATGSGLSYVGVNSDDVFNNSGWIFEACPNCLSEPPATAPVLDPASVTSAIAGQPVTLILENLPAGYEAVWFDSLQNTQLYASSANLFQPVINAPTTFYAAVREIATGCISELLEVQTTIDITGTAISGKIIFENDDVTGVGNATLNLTGAATASTLSDVNGNYSLTVNTTGNFTLKPVKNINRLNGVTIGDVARIQQHAVGNLLFEDPYKMIAADINYNNQISTQDATLLQQAILNNPATLAVFNRSWRFIDASVTLDQSPWQQLPLAEQINLNGASGTQANKDFIGIKIGDVTAPSADPANRPEAIHPLIWTLQDQALTAGEQLSVTFKAAHFENLAAYQFGLGFDPTRLAYNGWESASAISLQAGNFGFTETALGEIRSAWFELGGKTLSADEVVFTITFQVLQSGGKLSEVLNIDTDIMPAVAYTPDLQPQEVLLEFSGSTTDTQDPALAGGLQLFQNQPNPFSTETVIGFVMPAAGEARLRIFDATGRLVSESLHDCSAGVRATLVVAPNPSGLFTYELTTPYGTLSRKMVRTP